MTTAGINISYGSNLIKMINSYLYLKNIIIK